MSQQGPYKLRRNKTGLHGFLIKSATNQAAQLLNMARGLKFCIWEVEGLYYLCSWIFCDEKITGYWTTDLHFSSPEPEAHKVSL